MIIQLKRYTLGFSTSALGLSFLVLFGVPTNLAIRTIFVVMIQVTSGYQIFKFVFKVDNSKLSEILSFGFTFGTIVSFCSDQIFLHTKLESIGWLIPAVFIAVAKLFQQRNSVPTPTPTNHLRVDLQTLLLASTVTILFLCLDYLWMQSVLIVFSIGVITCVLIKLIFQSRFTTSSLFFITFIVCCFFLTNIVKSRNTSWWAISDDFGFFEALQNSIAKFGFYDKWGIWGDNWSSYHFLVYGVTGTLNKVIDAPTWVVLSQIGPPLFAFFLALSIIHLWISSGVRNSPAKIITIISFPFFFFYSYTSPSFVFGEIIMVQLITIFLSKSSRRSLNMPWAGACLLAIVAFYSKMTNTPQLSLFLTLGVFTQIGIRRMLKLKESIGEYVFLLTSVCLFIWTTVFNSDVKGRIQILSLAGFAYERVGSLMGLTTRYERYFAVLLVITRYVLLPTIACLAVWRLAIYRSEPLARLLIPISASAFLLCMITGRGNMGYFVTAALQTSYLLTLIITCRLTEGCLSKKLYSLFFSFGAVFGAVGIHIAESFNGGSFRDIAAMALGKSNLLLLIVFPLLCIAFPSTRSHSRVSMPNFSVPLLLVFLCGAVVGQGLVDMRRPIRGPELSESEFAIAIGTESEHEVGLWLKNNTPTQSIIASNHGIDNTNFMLPLFSERRFLIQGPRFVGGNQISKSVLTRIALTKNFVSDLSKLNMRALIDEGVDYFVIDLRLSKLRQMTSDLKPIFESNEFLVLNLQTSILE